MSRFSEQAAVSLVPALFFEHGDAVTFLPADAAEVYLTAIVEAEESAEVEDQKGGRVQVLQRQVTVCTDAALGTSQGIGSITPRLHLRLMIGSVEYQVAKVDSATPPIAVLTVTRPEQRDRTRPGYRNANRRS